MIRNKETDKQSIAREQSEHHQKLLRKPHNAFFTSVGDVCAF